MNSSADDLRRHYEERSDAGLRDINREELTDLAKRVYDEEIERRGLQPEAQPEAGAAEARQELPDNLVLAATFLYPVNAKFARAELEGEGIPCYLENEHTLDIDWFLSNLLGGYRLLVPASDLERARAILDTRVSDEELEAQAEAAGAPPDGRP